MTRVERLIKVARILQKEFKDLSANEAIRIAESIVEALDGE